MVKVRMSLLTMSLLAITLAAAIAHAARLDPSLNSASGTGGGFIPYLECIAKCDECTTCTKVWPMWKNVCICVNHTKSAISEKPALQSSGKLNEMIPESISVPIYECEEKCVKCTVCTLMLPWWINTCVCIPKFKPAADGSVPKKPIAAAAVAVQQAPFAEPELFPYAECDEKCKYVCVCAAIWPPPEYCGCSDPIKSSISKKPALQNSGGVDKHIVLWTKAKMETLPYKECIATCQQCACTLIYPPELATCICLAPKPQAVAVQLAPIAEPELFPYAECDQKCKFVCACLAIWPPPEYCSCSDPIKSSISKKPALQNSGGDDKPIVLWTKAKMATLSYKECIATCEQCVCTLIYPPELAICICLAPKPQAAGGKALPM